MIDLQVNDLLQIAICEALVEATIPAFGDALDDMIATIDLEEDEISLENFPESFNPRSPQKIITNDDEDDFIRVDTSYISETIRDHSMQQRFEKIPTLCQPCDEWMLNMMTDYEDPRIQVRHKLYYYYRVLKFCVWPLQATPLFFLINKF